MICPFWAPAKTCATIIKFMKYTELKPKQLHKEYHNLIDNQKKEDYYLKRFDKMALNHQKINFNIYAFIFGPYWCFYQKMVGLGILSFLLQMASFYLTFAFDLSWMAIITSVAISLYLGLFGTHHYRLYLKKTVAYAINLNETDKKKYYHNNGGDGTKLVVCMLLAASLMIFSLTASFGIPDTFLTPFNN